MSLAHVFLLALPVMPPREEKPRANARISVRRPVQRRALEKVELILEATVRLLDSGGLDALNTNAVARTAGVSIGTLYQYFPDKGAILDALARREREAMRGRVIAALAAEPDARPERRVSTVFAAVMAGYGDRPRVHRLILERALAMPGKVDPARQEIDGSGGEEDQHPVPVADHIFALLSMPGRPGPTLSDAEAFVLTHAFAGVLRAMILREDAGGTPPRAEIEAAFAHLLRLA